GREKLYRRLALFSAALAACLAVVVGVVLLRQGKPPDEPAAVAWGWAKPGAIPGGDQKPKEDLNQLANEADEWFAKRSEDGADVGKRLKEFRAGCAELVLAPHKQLNDKDREWLVERCRAWAGKLNEHLAALEAGRDPRQVRGEADETVRKLVK